MKKYIYAVLLIAIFALSASAQTTDCKTIELTDEELIQEIVFKKIIEPRYSDENIKAFYLSVGNADPSDNLMKKMNIYKLPVRKISEFIDVENGGVVLDETTYKEGIPFFISKLEWKSKNEVKLSVIIGSGNLGTQGCDYNLEKKDDKWKIVSEENCYVS